MLKWSGKHGMQLSLTIRYRYKLVSSEFLKRIVRECLFLGEKEDRIDERISTFDASEDDGDRNELNKFFNE